jgi:hypothetical protein
VATVSLDRYEHTNVDREVTRTGRRLDLDPLGKVAEATSNG